MIPEPFEELLLRHWGILGPVDASLVRDDPFRQTWWIRSRNGHMMMKWLGDPRQNDRSTNSLRLSHWATTQGAPVVQVLPTIDGAECLVLDEGTLAIFEYVDATVGVGDWRALGRAVGRLHTISVPEFAQRSALSPETAVPLATSRLEAFLSETRHDADLLQHVTRSLDILQNLPSFRDLPIGLIHTDLGIAHTMTRTTGEITFLDTLGIGTGPLILDIPPIACEHLSHLDTHGSASRLNASAAWDFLSEYSRFRMPAANEPAMLKTAHQAYEIIQAAHYIDLYRRSDNQEMLARAHAYFHWLGYVEEMVERDLLPLLERGLRELAKRDRD
jgi:phosphotransferase family enzyme